MYGGGLPAPTNTSTTTSRWHTGEYLSNKAGSGGTGLLNKALTPTATRPSWSATGGGYGGGIETENQAPSRPLMRESPPQRRPLSGWPPSGLGTAGPTLTGATTTPRGTYNISPTRAGEDWRRRMYPHSHVDAPSSGLTPHPTEAKKHIPSSSEIQALRNAVVEAENRANIVRSPAPKSSAVNVSTMPAQPATTVPGSGRMASPPPRTAYAPQTTTTTAPTTTSTINRTPVDNDTVSEIRSLLRELSINKNTQLGDVDKKFSSHCEEVKKSIAAISEKQEKELSELKELVRGGTSSSDGPILNVQQQFDMLREGIAALSDQINKSSEMSANVEQAVSRLSPADNSRLENAISNLTEQVKVLSENQQQLFALVNQKQPVSSSQGHNTDSDLRAAVDSLRDEVRNITSQQTTLLEAFKSTTPSNAAATSGNNSNDEIKELISELKADREQFLEIMARREKYGDGVGPSEYSGSPSPPRFEKYHEGLMPGVHGRSEVEALSDSESEHSEKGKVLATWIPEKAELGDDESPSDALNQTLDGEVSGITDDLTDDSWGVEVDPNDPRVIAHMMSQMDPSGMGGIPPEVAMAFAAGDMMEFEHDV
eukprot:TRINITY_DN36853_c0_g1_i1.p1 TRINITY_DN36853_c0_g1~~TRINITY_DN36853_c0_g1_i1.p1  ORF type:complete len:598 (+),score=131.21 TRINITY_DN36853_c0_g1_i1:42-1835(+)